jgi:hypothetical protein
MNIMMGYVKHNMPSFFSMEMGFNEDGAWIRAALAYHGSSVTAPFSAPSRPWPNASSGTTLLWISSAGRKTER